MSWLANARGAYNGCPSFLNTRRKRFLLRTGVLLLMLGLMAFSIYQCTGQVTMGLNTLRTQEINESSYARMDLYVFRDEMPVTVNGNLFAYDVRDGQRIGVGDTVAQAYTVSDTAAAADKQAWLNLYADRLSLAHTMAQGGVLSDIKQQAALMDNAYLQMLRSTDKGDMAGTFGYADVLLDSMDRYYALTVGGEDASRTASGLAAARTELLSGLAVTDTVVADRSGYFYYHTDGYESLFDYDAAMTMTPSDFLALTDAEAVPEASGTAGKMVWRTGWYAAAFISRDDAAAFEKLNDDGENVRIGVTYTMTCADQAGTALSMTLERLEYHEDGALIVFHSVDMPDGFEFDRCIGVETVVSTVSGYRVPAEAVVTLTGVDGGEETGVYILVGNVVEFRKLQVSVAYEGYLIARTYEDVQDELSVLKENDPDAYEAAEADGWLYLNLNDNIITRGTGLYEGKTVG